MFRLIMATICGYLIGLERKKHDKSGGSRTMALMCLSACIVAIISVELSKTHQLDILRLAQGTIQGIGFIGAGIIWHYKGETEGLTTAGILFTTILIGFLIGFNFWFYAILTSIIVYILGELKYWTNKGDS